MDGRSVRRRTVFRIAILIFTIGSVLCGLSVSLATIVASRVVQGFGGAMMVPVGRLIVLRTIPKSELVSAMSYLTVPAVLGPVVGPPVGGFIVTYCRGDGFSLSTCRVGLIGIALITFFIENVREQNVPPLDLRGFVLTGLGLAGLLFGLETIAATCSGRNHDVRTDRGRCMHRRLHTPLAARRVSDRGLEADVDSHLRHLDDWRRTLPHRHRSAAISAADAAAIGFRADAVCFGSAYLYQRMRGTLDEADRGADNPAARFPQRADRQRFRFRADPGKLFVLPSTTSHVIIVAAFFVGGFLRSLQFTALERWLTSSVARTPPRRAPRAGNISVASAPAVVSQRRCEVWQPTARSSHELTGLK